MQMLQENTESPPIKAASDCSVGLIKVCIYVTSRDDGTDSDKASNNSTDDASAPQITLYLLRAGSHQDIV